MAGHKTRRNQYRGIGCIGARGDGGNHHIAMAKVMIPADNRDAPVLLIDFVKFGFHDLGKSLLGHA